MGLVDVKFDTTKLSQWASELSERGFRNALRRAIDQSARAARMTSCFVPAVFEPGFTVKPCTTMVLFSVSYTAGHGPFPQAEPPMNFSSMGYSPRTLQS